MNPKTAKENFQRVKEKILEDGKIDENEVNVLLSFLEPYTRTYSVKFSTLKELLYLAKANGKVENQSEIIKALDEAEDFLRTEYKIERCIGYCIAFILMLVLFCTILP